MLLLYNIILCIPYTLYRIPEFVVGALNPSASSQSRSQQYHVAFPLLLHTCSQLPTPNLYITLYRVKETQKDFTYNNNNNNNVYYTIIYTLYSFCCQQLLCIRHARMIIIFVCVYIYLAIDSLFNIYIYTKSYTSRKKGFRITRILLYHAKYVNRNRRR